MPVVGIVHAAAVLDDALLANVTDEQIARVLGPKIAGAEHIDSLTREDPLAYFLLYSSITTLIGNVGQSAYVAANAYLEGLARRRRAEGRPALAIRWGAIADAGMLQRDARTAAILAQQAGAGAMPARQALDLLTEAMRADDGSVDHAVVTLAAIAWAEARRGLPLLSSPLFAEIADTATSSSALADKVDLAAAIQGLDEEAAAEVVARHLASELAQILRMSSTDINLARPLAELGLDSLMAIELRLAASRKLGIEIPIAALSEGLSLHTISARSIPSLRGTGGVRNQMLLETDLANMHTSEGLAARDIEALTRHIEERAPGGG
jgi:acyl carrier protein